MPPPSRFRALLSQVRTRLSPPVPVVGQQFRPGMHDEWNELEEQVDGYLKKIGASVVGSWEVAAADLARVLVGRPDDKVLLERFSDAIVPALQPFQDLHKAVPGVIVEGRTAGDAAGTLAAATRPLVVMLVGLDVRAEAGWAKTVEYLGPLFAAGDAERSRLAMASAGPKIAAACRSADTLFREQLARLPQAPRLWDGVCEPFDAYQLALSRELEIEIHRASRGMIAALGTGN